MREKQNATKAASDSGPKEKSLTPAAALSSSPPSPVSSPPEEGDGVVLASSGATSLSLQARKEEINDLVGGLQLVIQKAACR